MSCRLASLLPWLPLVLLAALSAPLAAEDAAADSAPLSLQSIRLEPEKPGPGTLARLWIQVANGGDRPASHLAFRVTVDGDSLSVYDSLVYMLAVPSGETTELQLHNFWTPEEDGGFEVEVSLTAAQWMEIGAEEGIEVRRPVGPVESLPQNVTGRVESP